MLNHVSIGVSSLNAAKTFYDAALSALGYRCLSEDVGSLAASLKDPDGVRIEAYCHGNPQVHRARSV